MSNYKIEKLQGVLIVYAPNGLGIEDFAKLLSLAGENAYTDMALAQYLDAHSVIGNKQALADMRQNLPEPGPSTANEAARAKAMGLSKSAIDWLLGLERGTSSETLFYMATGCHTRGGKAHHDSMPFDASEMKRCIHLANVCTEVRLFIESQLTQANNIPASWRRLFSHWTELKSMDDASINTFLKDK